MDTIYVCIPEVKPQNGWQRMGSLKDGQETDKNGRQKYGQQYDKFDDLSF